jgi:4-amino-4-deoxy-L-arabinose transferase-like glycosyltransferase
MKRRTYGILVPLLLAAFALRIYRLPQLSLRADEAVTVFDARVPWAGLLHELSQPGPHQPLYYLLLHGWMQVAGEGELAVRYLTLSCGVLLLPLVYVLGRRLFAVEGRKVALWAALLAAVSPLLVWDAQDNRMYPLLAVLDLASFYFCVSLLQGHGGRRPWLGFVVCTTLALYTHYLAVFVVLAEYVVWAIFVWRLPDRRGRLGRWIAAQAAVVLLFGPRLLRSLHAAAQFTTDFLPSVPPLEMLRRAVVGLSLGYSMEASTGTLLALGFVAVGLLGLLPLAGRERETPVADVGSLTETQSLLILLIYMAVPLACIAVFSAVRFPIFDERYAMLSLPAYLLLLGRGLSNLSRPGSRRLVAAVGLAVIVLGCSWSLRNYYFVPGHMKGVNWRAYVARLQECALPGDVLVQNYPDPALPYHLRDRVPRVLVPASFPVDTQDTVAELRRLSETYSRIWLQPQQYDGWDGEGIVETWLDRHAQKAGEEALGRLRLALYVPPTTLGGVIVPVQAAFGDRITLVGYLLEEGGKAQRGTLCEHYPFSQTAALNAGSQARLTLFWRASGPTAQDYTVFTHVYGPDGRIWAQKDNQPVSGTFPTGQWEPGDVIVDRYEIQLDPQMPAGDYRLAV